MSSTRPRRRSPARTRSRSPRPRASSLERSWYGTEKQEQARTNILEITDPFAVKALSTYLTSETTRDSKQLFIDALTHVGTAGAMDVLAKAALK